MPLGQLFSALEERASRSLLCEVFKRLSRKYEEWSGPAGTVSKLNSWDSRIIDEPDYDMRLEGFSEAKQLLLTACQQGEGPVQWTAGLVDMVTPHCHTCLFYLLQCSDMSIRDASASYISELIKTISTEDKEAFQTFVLSAMVPAVKQGLRSKEDFARREVVNLLSKLVHTYKHHTKFSDLASLHHTDPEADFFLNIRHIQLHRRTRAFRKLAKLCSEGSIGQGSSLDFLLPLANHVVFAPSTNNTEQNLIAEAVNVVGAISRHLSWSNYSFILGHYLRQLSKSRDFQKNLIKVAIAVLDNFHFDLSLVSSEAELGVKGHSTAADGETAEQSAKVKAGSAEQAVEDVAEGGEALEMAEEEEVGSDGDSNTALCEEAKRRALARKIYHSIVKTTLPSLQQVLTKKIEVPGHKLSHLEQDVDSEVLRVPVAMAMTKLLLALPEEQLHTNLPNLLMKVCLTLANRSRDVRDIGRNTLVKMAASLGPKYLKYIISEMKESLTRGYMLHVLSYSLHYLLRSMSTPAPSSSSTPATPPTPTPSLLAVGDLDPCLDLISEILIEDLFGVPAEERECGENIARIPESKTPQSFNSCEVAARFLSPKLLPQLLAPVKEVLEARCSSRTSRVVEEVFRRVAVGIQGNLGFSPQALLIFVYEVLSDSIPQLTSKTKRPKPSTSSLSDLHHPSDHRLLPPTPERSGPRPVNLGNVGASIVTEFGLQLLHVSLKHGKFDTSDSTQLSMLDPFVALLSETLSSPHSKVLTRALHCLVWVVRLPLPSLEVHVDDISVQLFALLRRYARAGMAVGNNRELVTSSFKAMTVIVRDFKKHEIKKDELQVLLSFVEEDIHDYQRQSTAFPLLKAILSRKLLVDEIYDIMRKVESLSLTSDSEHVRLQSRQALLQFLMDYPLKKKFKLHLDFHVTNLDYQEQSGRESMLQQLISMFTRFRKSILNRHSAYFFVPLSLRLLNEESPTCRQMVATAIKALLQKLDTERRNEIALIIETWIKDDKVLHRRLGVQTLGLLVEADPSAFLKRLSVFLPLLHKCLEDRRLGAVGVNRCCGDVVSGFEGDDPKEGVEKRQSEEEEEEEEERDDKLRRSMESKRASEGVRRHDIEDVDEAGMQRDVDHLLFSSLSTLNKVCMECDLMGSNSSLPEDMDALWDSVCSLLLHPHSWVRLLAAQLLGLLFASCSPDDLVTNFESEDRAETEGCGLKRRKKGKKTRKSDGVGVAAGKGHYLLQDTLSKVQELTRLSCVQLNSPLLSAGLANQVVKNLVYLSKVLHRLDLSGKLRAVSQREEMVGDRPEPLQLAGGMAEAYGWLLRGVHSDSSDQEEGGPKEMEEGVGHRGAGESERSVKDLTWLMRRMSRLAGHEAGHSPKESIKRTHILQWIGMVCLDLGPSSLSRYLPFLLPPLHRELSDTNKTAGEDLSDLANEVVELMKEVCGKEAFSVAYARLRKEMAVVRVKRRGQAALEAVMDPEKNSKRRKRKNELKKASKRKRVDTLRPFGHATAKRRRL